MARSSDELFPSSPRVIYEKAPLIQVICQLRFPTLLTIEGKLPAEFQEKIRDHFPLFQKGTDNLPPDLPAEIVQLLQAQSSAKSYQFLTEDRATTVTLTAESLALTTTNYTQWEEFRAQLHVPLRALNEIYRPSFFSRIGLRYQDALDRDFLDLKGTPWSALLQNAILGELALPEFEAALDNVANRVLRLTLPDATGSLNMRHGLANISEHKDTCYLIDFDFFTEKRTEVSDAEGVLNHFNELAGRAFRWCITNTLRDALGPRDLETKPG